ncbi:MAG: phosphatidylserine/phosphatidylglycerophosphate/cardiolipin synthase family protein [Candidatus Binatia bacterium]
MRAFTDLRPPPVVAASYSPRTGNSVDLLVDGQESFGRIFGAIENARNSVWITVSFVDLGMEIRRRSCTLLDLLDAVAGRGIDVRLLFWWSEYRGVGSFRGDDHELEMLTARACQVKMRWDRVPGGCHHQKSYVIDEEAAFVGGINLTPDGMSSPAHGGDGFHDLFAELRGPSVADVAHNFLQRWNGATETLSRGHAWPSRSEAGELDAAVPASPEAGSSTVQVVRTIRRGLYSGGQGWHDGHRFDLEEGEYSVRDAVLAAIDSAESSIYIENQYLIDTRTITFLGLAARRGVEVIVVVPVDPDPNLLLYPEKKMAVTKRALAELAVEKNLGLFGLRRSRNDGSSVPEANIYVHSKLLIVDESFMSIGSANLWPPSYHRDSEMNLLIWDATLARSTRDRLWREHLGGSGSRSLGDWLELATPTADGPNKRGGGRVRAVRLDPRHYYDFGAVVVAPWAGARRADP